MQEKKVEHGNTKKILEQEKQIQSLQKYIKDLEEKLTKTQDELEMERAERRKEE